MNQNLSSYYVFYMVVKKGNISAASKELFISQPAVSKSVTKLENNLNTKLLNRGSRGVSLTREGKILYERLEDAFHAIELGEEQLKFESKAEVQHLTIGVSSTLCKYILLPYLKEFMKLYPHIRISIDCNMTYEILQSLGKDEIDLGLIGEPEGTYPFIFSRIRSIEDTFVTNKNYLDHLLIRTGINPQSIAENYLQLFQQSTLMLMDKENLSRRYVEQYILANEIQAANLMEVASMDLLIEFATIGLGISCVIKNFVEDELKNGTLVEIPMPFHIPKRNVGFVYPKKQYKNPALEAFLDFYKNTII